MDKFVSLHNERLFHQPSSFFNCNEVDFKVIETLSSSNEHGYLFENTSIRTSLCFNIFVRIYLIITCSLKIVGEFGPTATHRLKNFILRSARLRILDYYYTPLSQMHLYLYLNLGDFF